MVDRVEASTKSREREKERLPRLVELISYGELKVPFPNNFML